MSLLDNVVLVCLLSVMNPNVYIMVISCQMSKERKCLCLTWFHSYYFTTLSSILLYLCDNPEIPSIISYLQVLLANQKEINLKWQDSKARNLVGSKYGALGESKSLLKQKDFKANLTDVQVEEAQARISTKTNLRFKILVVRLSSTIVSLRSIHKAGSFVSYYHA